MKRLLRSQLIYLKEIQVYTNWFQVHMWGVPLVVNFDLMQKEAGSGTGDIRDQPEHWIQAPPSRPSPSAPPPRAPLGPYLAQRLVAGNCD